MLKISLLNQKGGVGKSTSTRNLADYFAMRGKRVLMADIDGQGNLSQLSNCEDKEITMYEAFKGETPVVYPVKENIDIIPNTLDFSSIEIEIAGVFRREMILDNILNRFAGAYDLCFIDCPPNLGLVTINAMATSDFILIPMEASYFSYRALERMVETLNQIKDAQVNPKIAILGIFLTKFVNSTVVTRDVLNDFQKDGWDMGLFQTKIRLLEDFRKAEYKRMSIFEHKINSNAAKDYESLGNEIYNKLYNIQ
jgi:chromosome partitioning protein